MNSNSQKLSIARLSTVPFFVKTQLLHQIMDLIEIGHDVTVIASYEEEFAEFAKKHNIRYLPVEIPRSINIYRDLRALFRLIRIFSSNKFDIVHSTTPKAGLLSALAAFICRIPVRLHTFTGQAWIGLSGAKKHFARWSDWIIGLLNTRCYADSGSQRDFLISRGIVNPKNIRILGSGSLAGVNLERFDPEKFSDADRSRTRQALNIAECDAVLLFIGRVTPEKGINELLMAFNSLVQGNSNIHLLILGPLETESGVSNRPVDMNLMSQNNVHYLGFCPDPEKYLAIADLFCLPSYREGFGTVVIEAAAMKVPAVGSNIYGLSDAIVDNQTGVLVEPRNSKQLAGAIAGLLKDDALRNTMAATARKRVEKKFDSRQVSILLNEEYMSLFNEKIRER